MNKSKVYYTKEITPSSLVEMYKAVGKELTGKVAVKVHSGEKGNQNYLRPEFLKELADYVGGTIVECNTAYNGERNTTDKHTKLMEDHGWSKCFNVDILDSEGPDLEIAIPNGTVINKNYLGKNIKNYDSMLVVSHFKGHPMGGYGGALKQLSIGFASAAGKAWIHSAGVTNDVNLVWKNTAPQDKFLEAMAESASSVVDYFKGNIVYINIMCNMSVDCDCCAKAEEPCMKDIGVLVSTDPVAIDQASIDLVKEAKDIGKEYLLERINSRHGTHTIDVADKLGVGSKEYDLIEI